MKRDYIEFQDRSAPVAFMITFRCYGTWLQGDERGSVDRKTFNRFGTPKIEPDAELEDGNFRRLKQNPYELGPRERPIVVEAIKRVCRVREYDLYGLNVRSNHVHVVVAYANAPEHIMNSFKAYATRALRAAGLLGGDQKAWSRHGSTKYLWTDEELANVIDYVLYSQD
jgi:hypothetical protein